MYCKDCEVSLTQINPEFRSKADKWINEHWFLSENWKWLHCSAKHSEVVSEYPPCESCGFFVQSHTKTWEELAEEASRHNY